MPKAPPTSSVRTRICPFSHFRKLASASRIGPAPCEQVRKVVTFVAASCQAVRAARLHRGDNQALIDDGDARDMRGLGESVAHRFLARGRIGGRAGPVDGDIAGHVVMHLRRAGFHRVAHIGDRRQRVILDIDQLRAVERREFALRDHGNDRLADMRHALARERRPVRHAPAACRLSRPEPADGWKCCRCRLSRYRRRSAPRSRRARISPPRYRPTRCAPPHAASAQRRHRACPAAAHRRYSGRVR